MSAYPLLLIEDKPDVVDWFVHAFGERADHVRVAACVADARILVRQQPFATIILDLALPDFTGGDLLPVLRDAHPDALLLVFAAYASDEHIIRRWNRARTITSYSRCHPPYSRRAWRPFVGAWRPDRVRMPSPRSVT